MFQKIIFWKYTFTAFVCVCVCDRCALSVLQKECRKFWGVRYRLGNTVNTRVKLQAIKLTNEEKY